MRRTSFTQSLLGVVGLMMLVGCGELTSVLEAVRENRDGKVPGTTPSTGTGGATGASTRCTSVPGPDGAMCKQCVDVTGKIVSEECSGGGTGSGGMSGSEPVSCMSFEQGGPTSCKDVGTWKMYAYEDCTKRNLVFTDYKPQISCGEGSYQSVSYVCCSPSPTPPPPPPMIKCGETADASGRPCKACWDQYGMVVRSDCATTGTGGSTGGGSCTRIVDGGPSSCKDIGTWKTYGTQRCADQMLTLTDVQPLTMCEGGIESVAYVCCGQTPPPPPPVKCEATMGPNGEACKICYDANGKAVSRECSAGSPTQCFRIQDGGPTSCKDEGTWKMYGVQRCAEQKATLTEVTPLKTCEGGLESVAYVCCPTAPTPTPDPSPVKCEATMDANGRLCKTCWDATGQVVATDCVGGSTYSCKSWTNDAGAVCTECVDNGKVVSSGCKSPEPPPVGMCAVEIAADGSKCEVCYYPNGLKTSSCPTTSEPK